MPAPTLVWFRNDLRMEDNPALSAAATDGPAVCLFILDDACGRPLGAASRWWVHHSLSALAKSLAARGGRLTLRRGAASAVLDDVIEKTGARTVVWNRRYDGPGVAQDKKIMADLKARGLEVKSCNAALLFEPWTIRTGSDTPFKVFTPFWKACLAAPAPDAPTAPPEHINSPKLEGDDLLDWDLLPARPNWAKGFEPVWTPGEAGAHEALEAFLGDAIDNYRHDRNLPSKPGTSRLSPHLRFGDIGPRQIWHAVHALAGEGADRDQFLAEIGWREFSHHLLFHHPDIAERNLKPAFDHFDWARDAEGYKAWSKGQTGYPIVDAGLRELWATGWMHNRVRMIVASFLIKDLRLDWREGERWFWDTLVDACPANNPASWQWVAGSGMDAAPYFRIFNPTTQGETWDPDGAYVRRWVPELAKLPDAWIHKPHQAPGPVLARAGVELGADYPRPVVDHARAREAALAAFSAIRQ